MFDPLVGIGAVTVVQSGYQFTEGPQWREAERDFLFSDIPANTIYRWTPGTTPVSFRSPSRMSNGLAIDGAGKVIAAEHGARAISRDDVAVVSTFEGKRLNSPNDVVVADDGTIYFTDPPYGIQDNQRELDFVGLFRVAPGGALTAERRDPIAARPNGVALSPDGKTLYANDTADGKIYKYPVLAGGALGARANFATSAGNPDGMAVDSGGNVLVATRDGVEAFSPAGQRWGVIAVPQQPSNCAFGGADHKTLLITARTAVYRVDLANAGLPLR
jgi:gluconolactonase